MNAAQKLLASIGVVHNETPFKREPNGSKMPSATKKGSGRYHLSGHSKFKKKSVA